MSTRAQPSLPALRVLVVEDEAALCEAFEIALTRAGFSVTVAFDGSSAWDELQRHHFDVVITDVRMPVMGGVELWRRIRRGHDPQMPVILTTGGNFVPTATDLSGYPLIVLQKPISPGELAARVRELCRNDAPDAQPAEV